MDESVALDNFLNSINQNLYKIINTNKIMEILNKNLKLSSIDIVNRIIIAITYNKEVSDIKTDKEWQLYGRRVINENDIIQLLIPIETSEFIDTETKEKIDLNEFNTFELEKAIEYGIIEKIENIRDFKVGNFYDIKNTVNIDDKAYKIDKIKADLSSLVKIFTKMTKSKVEKVPDNSTIVYYSKSENTLFIPKIDYNSLIIQISNLLFDTIVENDLKHYIIKYHGESTLNEVELKLLRESTIFSIASMYDAYNTLKFKSVFEENKDISVEDMIKILVISDDITYKIVQNSKDLDGNHIDDVVNNAVIAEKAEKLLNVATASALYDKLLH